MHDVAILFCSCDRGSGREEEVKPVEIGGFKRIESYTVIFNLTVFEQIRAKTISSIISPVDKE